MGCTQFQLNNDFKMHYSGNIAYNMGTNLHLELHLHSIIYLRVLWHATKIRYISAWRSYDMENFRLTGTLRWKTTGDRWSPATNGFPHKWPVMPGFDIFLNSRVAVDVGVHYAVATYPFTKLLQNPKHCLFVPIFSNDAYYNHLPCINISQYFTAYQILLAMYPQWASSSRYIMLINTLKPRQNRRRFADDDLKCIFLNENVWIPIKISLKFVPKGPIGNIPAWVQIMARRRPGDKPLSEPMMVRLPTHICVTRLQWVKHQETKV